MTPFKPRCYASYTGSNQRVVRPLQARGVLIQQLEQPLALLLQLPQLLEQPLALLLQLGRVCYFLSGFPRRLRLGLLPRIFPVPRDGPPAFVPLHPLPAFAAVQPVLFRHRAPTGCLNYAPQPGALWS